MFQYTCRPIGLWYYSTGSPGYAYVQEILLYNETYTILYMCLVQMDKVRHKIWQLTLATLTLPHYMRMHTNFKYKYTQIPHDNQ